MLTLSLQEMHAFAILSTTPAAIRGHPRCCSIDPIDLWEEEIEQLQHLEFMAAQARRLDELKEIARPSGQRTLPQSKDAGDEAEFLTPEEAEAAEGRLWDEDVESMELLQEAAAWDRQVGELRAMAKKDAELRASAQKGTTLRGMPPTMLAIPGPDIEVLPLPLDLLASTNLGAGKTLERCYRASEDGWSALDFHRQVDGRGSVVVVGELESGELVGGYNPTGWESRDDYRATPRAFLFCSLSTSALEEDEERTWTQLGVLGPGDVAIFDYARGGPQFGAADLVIGAPLAPVMGGLSGPDTMDDTRTSGDLHGVSAKLGGSYERMPSGMDFPAGELVELEAYCNAAFGFGCGRLQRQVQVESATAGSDVSRSGSGANDSDGSADPPSVGWWPF